jgi:hypothetical protein
MSREEAEARAAALNREHPDRHLARWLVRNGADGWHVARVSLPGGVRVDPLKPTIAARPTPADAPAPRPPFHGDVAG